MNLFGCGSQLFCLWSLGAKLIVTLVHVGDLVFAVGATVIVGGIALYRFYIRRKHHTG